MKKILLVGLICALVIFCLPSLVFGQTLPVNIHQYSKDIVVDDSTEVSPILLVAGDADTSKSFDLSTFNSLSTQFKFGFHGPAPAHADSCAMRIYFQTTNDDTSWSKVDSIVAASLTVAKLVEYSGADTTYVKGWTIPKCALKGRFIFVADASIAKNGINIRPKNFKQR